MNAFNTSRTYHFDILSRVADALRADGNITATDLGAALATALGDAGPSAYEAGRDYDDDVDLVLSFWRECRDGSDFLDESLMAAGRLRYGEHLAAMGYTARQVDRATEEADSADMQVMQADDGVVVCTGSLVPAGDEDAVIDHFWDTLIAQCPQPLEVE